MTLRPWNLEGLMAARVLVAAGAPLSHIGEALDRFGWEVDHAMWALVGRSPEEALYRLNGGVLDRAQLRDGVLEILARGSAEARELAAALNAPLTIIREVLWSLAEADLVDFHEPPPPCGADQARWFVLRRGAAA